MVRCARANFIRDGKLAQTKYHRKMDSAEMDSAELAAQSASVYRSAENFNDVFRRERIPEPRAAHSGNASIREPSKTSRVLVKSYHQLFITRDWAS
jgi:hypothetical protein